READPAASPQGLPRASVRADDSPGAAAADPPGAPQRQQVRQHAAVPLRSRAGREPVHAPSPADCRHHFPVHRGDRQPGDAADGPEAGYLLMTDSRSVGFVSLGCPKALVDSERILTRLRAEGYAVSGSYRDADVVVVNTCGFIES